MAGFLGPLLAVASVWLGCDKPPEKVVLRPAETASPSATAASSQPSPHPPSPEQAAAPAELITGPPGDEPPLIVAVHGLGDHPKAFIRLFRDFPNPARVVALAGPVAHGGGRSWFALGGELDETGPRIAKAAADLADRIRKLQEQHAPGRKVVVTGFSQGGALSFALALQHPDLVRCAVPVGGWIPSGLEAEASEAATVFALHGKADERVPFGPTERAVRSLKAAGAPFEVSGFVNVGHAIPPEVRAALYRALDACLDETAK